MRPDLTGGHAVIERGRLLAARALAVMLGPPLMVAGLGMTMSVVLLPFGLVFGVIGVLLLVWGLFG